MSLAAVCYLTVRLIEQGRQMGIRGHGRCILNSSLTGTCRVSAALADFGGENYRPALMIILKGRPGHAGPPFLRGWFVQRAEKKWEYQMPSVAREHCGDTSPFSTTLADHIVTNESRRSRKYRFAYAEFVYLPYTKAARRVILNGLVVDCTVICNVKYDINTLHNLARSN